MVLTSFQIKASSLPDTGLNYFAEQCPNPQASWLGTQWAKDPWMAGKGLRVAESPYQPPGQEAQGQHRGGAPERVPQRGCSPASPRGWISQ